MLNSGFVCVCSLDCSLSISPLVVLSLCSPSLLLSPSWLELLISVKVDWGFFFLFYSLLLPSPASLCFTAIFFAGFLLTLEITPFTLLPIFQPSFFFFFFLLPAVLYIFIRCLFTALTRLEHNAQNVLVTLYWESKHIGGLKWLFKVELEHFIGRHPHKVRDHFCFNLYPPPLPNVFFSLYKGREAVILKPILNSLSLC